MSDSSFAPLWESYRQRTEQALTLHLRACLHAPERAARNACNAPDRLQAAIEYACLNSGKRFRAMLVYAFGAVSGDAPDDALDAAAAAVEMIHAYSLIHDDLPAMDDDDLRRGKPSCHIAFDEATAILAGDALQSAAFETLSSAPMTGVAPQTRLAMIEVLARAIGARGMAGGQQLDMDASAAADQPAERCALVERIHRLKTGELIRAATRLGSLAAGAASAQWRARADEYATCLGLAFQIADDLLDDSAASGKTRGSDRRMDKLTWASMHADEHAREQARQHSRRAIEIAATLGDDADLLVQLARFAAERKF